MKIPVILLAALVLLPVTRAASQTNGFLVFEIDRYTYTMGNTNRQVINQKFKVPLTEDFMSNFKHLPSHTSRGSAFLFTGGNLKTEPVGTHYTWSLIKTGVNRWRVEMWGSGAEKINGVTISSQNPVITQILRVKSLEDLDMDYMLAYNGNNGGINISFKAMYVPAKDMEDQGNIPDAPVLKADHTGLFKGDDLIQYPLVVNCRFQEE